MKLSSVTLTIAILSSASGAAAFVSPSSKSSMRIAMSTETESLTESPTIDSLEAVELSIPSESEKIMSQSLPFMERPPALTGALAGDVGFDPIGFAKTNDELMNYREAEVKHARLAMLAAAGWPLSELFDKKIAAVLNLDAVLDAGDRVPSILNGGLGKVSPIYWVTCIGLAAAIDLYGVRQKSINNPSYVPGDLGFDPLGVYPKDEEGQKRMQLAEIKNGRLAMIAITAFAVQEFVSKVGVVNETPFFFHPLMQTLREYANSGYIQ